ncbi:MAG: hypothetical protein L6Q98_14320 [Anaerolineae bacterium]|nr:hypothetical protein [Anaerolineae bacterium]NUQ04809.1 hypothetical protein [Anaerolineae bacterium]
MGKYDKPAGVEEKKEITKHNQFGVDIPDWVGESVTSVVKGISSSQDTLRFLLIALLDFLALMTAITGSMPIIDPPLKIDDLGRLIAVVSALILTGLASVYLIRIRSDTAGVSASVPAISAHASSSPSHENSVKKEVEEGLSHRILTVVKRMHTKGREVAPLALYYQLLKEDVLTDTDYAEIVGHFESIQEEE